MVQGALIGALYVTLTYMQNLLLPGSASAAIQFRVSETLCVLALFSPSAVWGLTVGCLLFNLAMAGAMPLDIIMGTLASFFAAGGMYLTRRLRIFGYPLLAMLMPAVSNGLLVGRMLTFYNGLPFWLNGVYVALGEAGVLLSLGSLLFYALKARGLDRRLLG